MWTEVAALAGRVRREHDGRAWPSARWQKDPVGFARTILGVDVWSAQVEILEGIRDCSRVAIAGGRKIGKDFAVGIAAWWWYSSFPDAVVFMSATTAKQIDDILYVEIRRMYARSGKCLACKLEDPMGQRPPPCPHSAVLAGDVGLLARTGVTSTDFRRIFGYTSDKAEGLAGVSGPRILAIIDEASGFPEELHVAIRGNLAAEGCKEVLISNPTRARGFFFDAFHSRAGSYRTIQVSSESTPNIVEGRDVFPGLASRSWLEEQRNDWGIDSPLYKIHVLGQFVLNEQGAIFPVHALAEAEARWHDTPVEGDLAIGVDPAGETGDGDESGFAVRRGKKVVAVYGRRGLSPEAHLVEALGLLAVHRAPGADVPRVVLDREGEVGAKAYGAFLSYLQGLPESATPPFLLVPVRPSERAKRKPDTYDRVRDELCGSFADWLRDGGALPEDSKLEKELNAFRWITHVSGRTKAQPKEEMRKELGRSPDRADAVMLSTWGAAHVGATADIAAHTEQQTAPDAYEERAEERFDPYTWEKSFRR